MKIEISFTEQVNKAEVVALYQAVGWASAKKPELLVRALNHSDAVVIARVSGKLVGLCNALSDGYLVVYYSNFLVHPGYQGQGIGRALMEKMQEKYSDFHQQILVSYEESVGFYRSMGFERAGRNEAMWIYDGDRECEPSST
jgi:ribosomal protein S18 acetylase RimI-like enzyme